MGSRPVRPQVAKLDDRACTRLIGGPGNHLRWGVGIVVPHIVKRLTRKATNRAIFSIALFGAAFLVLADLGARTLISPAEIPIGVITAFIGAPFFLLILRTRSINR